MMCCSRYFFQLVALAATALAATLPSDRAALCDFKAAADTANYLSAPARSASSSAWRSGLSAPWACPVASHPSADPCDDGWHAVVCTGSSPNRVKELYSPNDADVLSGTISSTIGDLSKLERLVLSGGGLNQHFLAHSLPRLQLCLSLKSSTRDTRPYLARSHQI